MHTLLIPGHTILLQACPLLESLRIVSLGPPRVCLGKRPVCLWSRRVCRKGRQEYLGSRQSVSRQRFNLGITFYDLQRSHQVARLTENYVSRNWKSVHEKMPVCLENGLVFFMKQFNLISKYISIKWFLWSHFTHKLVNLLFTIPCYLGMQLPLRSVSVGLFAARGADSVRADLAECVSYMGLDIQLPNKTVNI